MWTLKFGSYTEGKQKSIKDWFWLLIWSLRLFKTYILIFKEYMHLGGKMVGSNTVLSIWYGFFDKFNVYFYVVCLASKVDLSKSFSFISPLVLNVLFLSVTKCMQWPFSNPFLLLVMLMVRWWSFSNPSNGRYGVGLSQVK